ncbi:MAG TPA: uroporphyrinogen decarboxylase family protein, partial [Tepidisphaeraceae bacterium]
STPRDGFTTPSTAIYAAICGRPGRKIPHWEHWSCPDAETYLTGIDYYDHPRLCRQKLAELYPQLGQPVYDTDAPRSRPTAEESTSAQTDDQGKHRVRWGDSFTWEWDWGRWLKDPEEIFSFSPLATDFTDIPVVESRDYRDEDKLYDEYRKRWPAEWTGNGPAGEFNAAFFYNTLFMWPLLSFGWENFMQACLDERFDRVLDEFAELSRRVFRVLSRMPVSAVICHDDIVTTRGPTCSPAWMRAHIFPRYEEYWSMIKATGKKVIFMSDGNMDAYADDVFACGADGIVTEPHTDYKTIARKHPDKFLSGEGDNRILTRNDPDEIKAMVKNMAETARMAAGYTMCIGNHIPWNVTPQGIKRYLDYSTEFACR